MESRFDFKKLLKNGGWLLLIITFIASVGFTDSRLSTTKCREVAILQVDSNNLSFVEESDILQEIHDKFGELKGKPFSSINISLLEKILSNNPFISRAEVFSTVDGKLIIEVAQRCPVVRIINFNHESFYIDDQGVFMPLSDKYTAQVPVANGFLFDREVEKKVTKFSEKELKESNPSRLDRVFMMAEYIHHHDFWKAQAEQIYVNAVGELELIPAVGNHTILFGSDTDISGSFDKLMLFYKEGLNKTGWNKYNVINLKFKDQVVCTKNK